MNHTLFRTRPVPATLVLAAAVALGGCASKGVAPVSQMATSRAAVTEAETAGGREHAPLELLSAREKLQQAETAVREENYPAARSYAEQAEADARLSEAKAHTAKAQRAVAEVQDSITALRNELERKTK